MAAGVGMPRKISGFAPIKKKSDKLIFIFQEISMSVIALTVTEFSRGLSNFLNQVQYQGQALDLARWAQYGNAYMSVVTASELLVGVERANTATRC